MTQRFHTEITADAAKFNAEMESAAQKAISATQVMQSGWRESMINMGRSGADFTKSTASQFDQLKEMGKNLRGILAGGATFGAAALGVLKLTNDTQKATAETAKMAAVMGTTTERASALKMALDDIGVETETYTGAHEKMVMKLREGEDRFNQLGVKTRDANGNLLSGDQIMQNSLRTLQQFKQGTDRNLASTELFGKGWADVSKMLKLTPAVMEEARIKAEQLEMRVGPEGVARAEAYRKSMADVGDVLEAFRNRIAQALMPVLTDFGNWFSSAAPAAVTVLRGVLGGFLSVWYGLGNAVVVVWQIVKAFLYNVTEPMVGFGKAMALAMEGNFAAAGQRLRQITPNVKAAWSNAWDEILSSSEKTRDRMLALFSFDSEQGAGAGNKGGGRTYTPKREGSRMGEWEAMLAAERDAYERRKLDQGSFEEYSKERERAFWKTILSLNDLSREEQAAVSRKYYAVERDIRKAAFEAEMAGIKAQLDLHKQGADERVAILQRIAAATRERYGAESKEAKQADAEVGQASRENAERALRLLGMEIDARRNHHMARAELERANIDQLSAMGIINGREKIELLRELKRAEFQIELQAAESRAQLLTNDVEAYRAAMEKIAEIRRKHAVDMKQLDTQDVEERKKVISRWIDPIGDAMQTMVNGVLQGTQRLSDIMRNVLRNMAAQYATTILKMGLDWVKNEILKTTATTAGVAARSVAEKTGAAQTQSSNATTATATIGAKAWEAAASVYAAIAEIPVVGPFLAPAMALAAAGTVLGFIGKIASARGGYDIPAGVNPVTQLHEEEMVLPADIAGPLRRMAAGGGEGGGGGAVNIYAWDARSLERYLRANATKMVPALRALGRNGVR